MAQNANLPQTPATYLRTLSIMHIALTAGQILFAIVALAQTKKLIINVRYTHDPLLFAVPMLAAGGFIVSNILYKKKLAAIEKAASLKEKLMGYQSAFIIRMAALEAPSLFAIVAFLITGQLIFLIIATVVVAYFIYLKPSKQGVQDALEMDYREQEAFSQGDKIL